MHGTEKLNVKISNSRLWIDTDSQHKTIVSPLYFNNPEPALVTILTRFVNKSNSNRRNFGSSTIFWNFTQFVLRFNPCLEASFSGSCLCFCFCFSKDFFYFCLEQSDLRCETSFFAMNENESSVTRITSWYHQRCAAFGLSLLCTIPSGIGILLSLFIGEQQKLAKLSWTNGRSN